MKKNVFSLALFLMALVYQLSAGTVPLPDAQSVAINFYKVRTNTARQSVLLQSEDISSASWTLKNILGQT